MSWNNGYSMQVAPSQNYQNMAYSGGQVPYQENRIQQLDRYMNSFNGQNNNGGNYSSNMNFIKVKNIAEAKEWVVQNNSEVWMQDSSEPYLYYKSVNNIGNANFRVLRVEDVTDQIFNNQEVINCQENINYVSVDEFNELNRKLDDMTVNYNQQLIDLQDRLTNYEQNISNGVVEEKKTVGRPKSNSTSKVGDK